MQRVEVVHSCGCRVAYLHRLGPWVLAKRLERALTVPCDDCEAREAAARANLETLMTRRPQGAGQLTLF